MVDVSINMCMCIALLQLSKIVLESLFRNKYKRLLKHQLTQVPCIYAHIGVCM